MSKVITIYHTSESNSSMITWSNLTSDVHATEFLKFYKSNIAFFSLDISILGCVSMTEMHS